MSRTRPYSAESTTASFGSRCISKLKDISMNPKVSNYQTDGMGRDSYIKLPNGGFTRAWNNKYRQSYMIRRSLTECIQNTPITSKFPIYRSNGRGRDAYIYSTCGGFYKPENTPVNYKVYFSNLRKYDYDNYVNTPIIKKKYDYNRYVKMFRKPKEIEIANNLAKRQRVLSARLSKPKTVKQTRYNYF